MNEERAYLLPPGNATELDLGCLIVFYPNRDEYRRALFGSLEYLTTWLAWERDVDKRGRDAALSWKLALDATKECFDMGFCDVLLGRLDTIIDILNDGICCAEQDVTDGQRYTDPVTDGVGDVPQPIIDSGWAADENDWDGFDDYKCVISHIMVESMEETLRELLEHVDSNGTIIGGIATLVAVLAAIVATGGATIIFGMIGAVGAAATIWRGIASLLDDGLEALADEVLASHDELACSIYNADGIEGAIVALEDKIDELFGVTEALVLKNLNIGPRLRGLYGGRYDQQDVAQALVDAGYTPASFDCSCDFTQFSYLFPSDVQGWANVDAAITWLSAGLVKLRANSTGSFRSAASENAVDIGSRFSVSTPITATEVQVKFRFVDDGPLRENRFMMRAFAQNHSYEESPQWSTSSSSGGTQDRDHNVWYEETWVFSAPIELDEDANSLSIRHLRTGSPVEIAVEIEYIKVY